MWCTQCHTAFDFHTGQIVTDGNIHNPHYYEWLRQQNNGAVPRNPGDVPCGDQLPQAWRLLQSVRQYGQDSYEHALMHIHRELSHLRYTELPGLAQPGYNPDDNAPLRVQYLLGQVDQTSLKKLLQQREKKRSKQVSVRQVYEMVLATCGDILRAVESGTKKGAEALAEIQQIEEYANECLEKIAAQYSSVAIKPLLLS